MIGKKPGQENWKMVESDQIQKTDHTEVYVSEQTRSEIGRKHSIAVQGQSEQDSLDHSTGLSCSSGLNSSTTRR